MKKFKLITYSIIITAVVLLVVDCWFMVRLYRSISDNLERDIQAALAELDVDELWYRSTHQDEYTPQDPFNGNHGRIEGSLDEENNFVTSRVDENGDTIALSKHTLDPSYSYVNHIIEDMSLQMHFNLDPYLPIRLEPLDSLLLKRLNNRGIYPKMVAVELASINDSIILENPKLVSDYDRNDRKDFNRYELLFNSYTLEKYVVYVPDVNAMVLKRMWGVMFFTSALILLFAFAFWYMWRFIQRQRNIEEMKDSFVNSMTHELKTPIAVAYSAADSLQRYYHESSAAHNLTYIGIILKELSKHTAMVENILSMSMHRRKNIQLHIEEVVVLPLIEDVCASQKLKAEKEKEVEYLIEVNPSTLKIKTDAMHFANILKNLVENAIKYSDDKVTIKILADDKHIQVTDNGIGIAQKYLSQIFDRFYRVPQGGNKYTVSGYGIGLYYVKEMCEKLGWTISVESQLDKGTTFTITF